MQYELVLHHNSKKVRPVVPKSSRAPYRFVARIQEQREESPLDSRAAAEWFYAVG